MGKVSLADKMRLQTRTDRRQGC